MPARCLRGVIVWMPPLVKLHFPGCTMVSPLGEWKGCIMGVPWPTLHQTPNKGGFSEVPRCLHGPLESLTTGGELEQPSGCSNLRIPASSGSGELQRWLQASSTGTQSVAHRVELRSHLMFLNNVIADYCFLSLSLCHTLPMAYPWGQFFWPALLQLPHLENGGRGVLIPWRVVENLPRRRGWCSDLY